jgi:hypothetical protein
MKENWEENRLTCCEESAQGIRLSFLELQRLYFNCIGHIESKKLGRWSWMMSSKNWAVEYIRHLDSGLLSRRLGFNPSKFHVGLVVGEVVPSNTSVGHHMSSSSSSSSQSGDDIIVPFRRAMLKDSVSSALVICRCCITVRLQRLGSSHYSPL